MFEEALGLLSGLFSGGGSFRDALGGLFDVGGLFTGGGGDVIGSEGMPLPRFEGPANANFNATTFGLGDVLGTEGMPLPQYEGPAQQKPESGLFNGLNIAAPGFSDTMRGLQTATGLYNALFPPRGQGGGFNFNQTMLAGPTPKGPVGGDPSTAMEDVAAGQAPQFFASRMNLPLEKYLQMLKEGQV